MKLKKIKYRFFKYRICKRRGLLSGKAGEDYIIQWGLIFVPKLWVPVKIKLFGVKKVAEFQSFKDAQTSIENKIEKKELIEITNIN